MKLSNILFTSLLLLIPSSPQESPELKEASDLTESVVKLIDEKRYGEALASAKRALEIRERLLPSDDPRIGNSLIYLIDIYTAKRDFSKAKEMLLRLLQHQTERFGAEHVKLAPTLERLAVHHFRDRENSKAEDAYKRAVALKEKEYGTDHVEVAHALFGLAELYRALRDFKLASPFYRRALRIYGNHLGVTSAEFERTSESYSCLGYETTSFDAFEDIKSIRNLLATPGSASEAPAGMILNGRALSLPKPDYPDAARENRLAGRVIVKVTIDETGKVVSAKDLCGGPPYLSEASVKAAYAARFSPTKIAGKPIQVTGVIQYNFVHR